MTKKERLKELVLEYCQEKSPQRKSRLEEQVCKHAFRYIEWVLIPYTVSQKKDKSDLIQEGCFGFLQALRRCDPSQIEAFSAYAYSYIKVYAGWCYYKDSLVFFKTRRWQQEAIRAYARWWMNGNARESYDHFLEKVTPKLALKHKLAKLTTVKVNEVLCCYQQESDSHTHILFELLDDLDVEEKLESFQLQEVCKKALKSLSVQEQEFLHERFFEEKTLEAIGEKRNVTRQRAQQIEVLALTRLKLSILTQQPSLKEVMSF